MDGFSDRQPKFNSLEKKAKKVSKDVDYLKRKRKRRENSRQAGDFIENRIAVSSVMLLSVFIDAEGESLYSTHARELFYEKFNVEYGGQMRKLIYRLTDNGFLTEDKSKANNPVFQPRGNHRRYYCATEKAKKLVNYLLFVP